MTGNAATPRIRAVGSLPARTSVWVLLQSGESAADHAGVERRGDGTLVRDVIDYEVAFGFLGPIANALFVRGQMERTFAQRQQTLPKLLA
jgi:hypothetical protein